MTQPSKGYFPVKVKVWGKFACFSRPEMKVERVSYEVMTPSAARGVLEAIFWKPEFHWEIREIWVLNPVRYFSLVRNEVNNVASEATAKRWSQKGGGYAAEEDRAQRHTLALRNPAYLIVADTVVQPGIVADPAKYRDQFRRRVARGQCYQTPCLGCREFAASFAEPDGTEQPIQRTVDLGNMLFDLDYQNDGSGRGQPRFFPAHLKQGILALSPELYQPKKEA